MSPDPPPSGPAQAPAVGRPTRADARRNRDRLLTAARAAFTASDTAALESIARDAGVGIGTLYRHFPTREALIDAVYAAELDDVTAGADTLLSELPPERALRAWMDRYTEFVATKRAMIGSLRAASAAGGPAASSTRERITATIATLLAAGARSGALRADIDPDDVTTMLLGVTLATAADETPDRADRLLDLILDALGAAGHGTAGP
ncbi:TetR/AcrR family transcriptional regulator [Nocardia sp. NPDC003345]